ncbi:histidine kinase [Halobacteriales archaeon QS_1_68_20]|nr:MAG: histidine kinase [Halobacteriales archaeon QS_1_68_20]
MPEGVLIVGSGDAADHVADGLATVDGIGVLRAGTLDEPPLISERGADCVVVTLPEETGEQLRILASVGRTEVPTAVLADGVAVPPGVDRIAPDDESALERWVRTSLDGETEPDGDEREAPAPSSDELFDDSPTGTLIVRDGEIRRANPAAAEVLGRGQADLVGIDPATLVDDPDRDGIEELLGAELPPDERRRCRIAVNGDGTVDVQARRLDDGTILATVVDVTERTRRHERITALHDATIALMGACDAESVAELTVETARDVLNLPFSCVFLNQNGVLEPVAITERAREIIGRPPSLEPGEGLLGRAYDAGETVAVDDAQRDPRFHEDGDEDVRGYVVVPLGEHGALAVGSPVVDDFDEFDVTVAELLAAAAETALDRVAHEQTLRERETALREERDRFSALFENIPDPTVHSVHEDGEPIVVDVNDAFEETFGYDAETMVGEPLDDFVVPEDRTDEAEHLNERVSAGEHLDVEVRRRTADGTRTFHLRNATVGVETDAVEEYAIYTDVTDRIERERELERQNEQLDAFASVVSHDLRNPLNVVLGGTRLVRETGDLAALDDVLTAAERMDALVEDLLSLAREGEVVGETVPVDLQSVAEDAWTNAETTDGNDDGWNDDGDRGTLSVESTGTLQADSTRLRELLANLFRNAVEHGGVTVTVGVLPDGFYVEDDGPGIPESDREQVFDHGYTTDDDGTGLGLTIVEEIAHAHGWDVEVAESDGGESGARFDFTGVEFE